MTLSLLNKSDLAILNKRSFNYKLADAEKDYMLAIASKIIYESELGKRYCGGLTPTVTPTTMNGVRTDRGAAGR